MWKLNSVWLDWSTRPGTNNMFVRRMSIVDLICLWQTVIDIYRWNNNLCNGVEVIMRGVKLLFLQREHITYQTSCNNGTKSPITHQHLGQYTSTSPCLITSSHDKGKIPPPTKALLFKKPVKSPSKSLPGISGMVACRNSLLDWRQARIITERMWECSLFYTLHPSFPSHHVHPSI